MVKGDLDHTNDKQKELYDENLILINQLKDLHITLVEKEAYIVELDGVVDQLQDKHSYDLSLKEKKVRQTDCEDSFEQLTHNTQDLINGLHHIRDKTGGNLHKNRLDDLERKLGRLGEKIQTSEGNNSTTG